MNTSKFEVQAKKIVQLLGLKYPPIAGKFSVGDGEAEDLQGSSAYVKPSTW
jgi:hypothetical protein